MYGVVGDMDQAEHLAHVTHPACPFIQPRSPSSMTSTNTLLVETEGCARAVYPNAMLISCAVLIWMLNLINERTAIHIAVHGFESLMNAGVALQLTENLSIKSPVSLTSLKIQVVGRSSWRGRESHV